MSIKIKICGITKKEEASYLNDAKVDYAGFVFFEKSKRNITVDIAKEIFSELSPEIKKVAVSVSPSVSDVEKMIAAGFDILQIHKELTKEVIEASSLPIWYAVNISDIQEANSKLRYIDDLPENLSSKIVAYVVDAPDFGSGKPFNWHKSRRMLKAGAQSPPNEDGLNIGDRQFILAGGLRPENVSEGIELFSPDIVDVSSGVEGDAGKDRELIMKFVDAVRRA